MHIEWILKGFNTAPLLPVPLCTGDSYMTYIVLYVSVHMLYVYTAYIVYRTISTYSIYIYIAEGKAQKKNSCNIHSVGQHAFSLAFL